MKGKFLGTIVLCATVVAAALLPIGAQASPLGSESAAMLTPGFVIPASAAASFARVFRSIYLGSTCGFPLAGHREYMCVAGHEPIVGEMVRPATCTYTVGTFRISGKRLIQNAKPKSENACYR